MKKITAVICVIFAFIMVMALPVSAGAPYQTYTYSINGTALHSPDAYTPAKSIDSAYMGLDDEAALKKYLRLYLPAKSRRQSLAVSGYEMNAASTTMRLTMCKPL